MCKWRIGRERRSKKARNNFCSERVESIPFLYLVLAFLSPRKAAAPLLLSYLSPGGGVLCILLGVLWGRKFSNSVTEVIIQCKFSFLFIGREPTTWPANNCLQIMVCSCPKTSNCVWPQILNIRLMRKWNHAILLHAIVLAWKWQIVSNPLKNKLGDRMIKQLSNLVIAKHHGQWFYPNIWGKSSPNE